MNQNNSRKTRVGILFGGKSAEHEVSLQSAKNVIEAINKEKYEVVPIGIDKTGKWHLTEGTEYLLNATDPKQIALSESTIDLVVAPGQELGKLIPATPGRNLDQFDVIFPVLHGTFGEDGTVQGLLKLLDIPFVGAGVLGSAVGMDKDVMKRLLRDAGLPIAKFLTVTQATHSDIEFETVQSQLGLPLFVKPANTGSSVGVSKVKDKAEFTESIAHALQYDRKVIIEQAIPGREIECSVLGNDQPVASMPGEIIVNADFYSYEAKYLDENGTTLKIPAELETEVVQKIQELAVKAFKVLECEGLARVDFFLTQAGEIYVNEINTLPGFTKISMYPKLWEVSGLSYTELIDRLIQLAIERHDEERQLKTSIS